VAFDESGHIREVVFDESGLIREMAFDERPYKRGGL
jgi:hypothetical protein